MRHPIFLLAAALAGPAAAQASNVFDGNWQLTLTCPATTASDGAKGYVYYFPVRVKDGELSAVHGTEGEPGWQHLHGSIAADGSAALALDGIVNQPDHAIGHATRGKAFSYKVLAQFEATRGAGQRTSGRPCDLRFTR